MVRSLWSRIDAAQAAAPFSGPLRTAALAGALTDWLDERLAQPDALEALHAALPWPTDRQVRDVASAVCRMVRMP